MCLSDLSSKASQVEKVISGREGFVEVKGGKVWFRIVGEEKPGIPLLTVHGGPGAPHDYLNPLEALAVDRPVIFYDQLGCGKSERPSDTSLWNVDRFVEELQQIRIALKLDKVHLIGQSWGTMLIVEYMLRKKPEGVKSIILSGPYLSTPLWIADQRELVTQLPQNIQDSIAKYEENGEFNSAAYQEAMGIFYNKHLCRLYPWPDCLNTAMEGFGIEVYNYMWGPSEFTMTGTLKNEDLTEKLDQISSPVLFTCGQYDEATPKTTRFYQSKIPGSEIYIFQDASHSHLLEKTEEYLDVVRKFLNR